MMFWSIKSRFVMQKKEKMKNVLKFYGILPPSGGELQWGAWNLQEWFLKKWDSYFSIRGSWCLKLLLDWSVQ